MKDVGKITSGIVHALNNVLASMRGRIELMQMEVSSESETYRGLTDVVEGIERAKCLISQMRTFSRIHEQEICRVNIVRAIEEALDLFKMTLKSDIELRKNIDIKGEEFVFVDSNQIEHVLMNILVNCSHAIGESGGYIDVSLSAVTVDVKFALKHANLTEGEYVQIRVKDTGEGMDAETINLIFEPFFTTKEVGKGTGLGLSMAHGIITESGGEIVAESELKKGTTIDIYLPKAQKSA